MTGVFEFSDIQKMRCIGCTVVSANRAYIQNTASIRATNKGFAVINRKNHKLKYFYDCDKMIEYILTIRKS